MTALDSNLEVLDLTGVSAWHDAGYTGKLGASATPEYFDKDAPSLRGLVTDGRDTPCAFSSHGYQTAAYHHLVVPDSRIVMLELYDTGSDVEKLKKYGVDVVYKSLSSAANQPEHTPLDAALGHCTMFCSAGNDAGRGWNRLMESACWYGVGAVRLKDGRVVTESYTSESDEVDFAGFAWLDIPSSSGKNEPYPFDGTSAACPFVAGQARLVNQIPLSKVGYPLSAAQMYAFLKSHSVDADAQGRDARTGWGYVRLPEPKIAERELFRLLKIGEKLQAEAEKCGRRLLAGDFIAMVRDWRLPE